MNAWRRWASNRELVALAMIVVFDVAALVLALAFEGAWQIVGVAGIGGSLVVLAFWKVPQWQADAARRKGVKKSSFELENDARRTLGEALSGLFLVVGLAVTWLQIADSRADQRSDRELAQQGQITDRFTKAVGQLSDNALQVRLGGIYALERIAHDSGDDVVAVMEVLTAFVRERAPWPPLPPEPGTPTPVADPETGKFHLPADVQAVLTVIERERWAQKVGAGDGTVSLPTGCLDLSGTDLRGARFKGTSKLPVCLMDANLETADLRGGRLKDADLTDSSLMGADLTGADLTDATLTSADLTCVVESQCTDLTDATLTSADLTGAKLQSVGIQYPNLTNANLNGAILTKADLQGTDLSLTLDLTNDQLDSAYTNSETVWPIYLVKTDTPPTGTPTP